MAAPPSNQLQFTCNSSPSTVLISDCPNFQTRAQPSPPPQLPALPLINVRQSLHLSRAQTTSPPPLHHAPLQSL
ncbi:hypothetical protein M0R45_025706 [Rubus argutus]|uniref:Uncharacterized protein n=1 Tax=Rubus argutus TaxID=59490 RepID=A0AAW1WYS7_RUBAR